MRARTNACNGAGGRVGCDWNIVSAGPLMLVVRPLGRAPITSKLMTLNPFDPPNEAGHVLERPAKISGLWIAVPYILPLFIMATFMNEAGWYGTGTSGWLQGVFRLVVFCFGVGCAYYVIICGSTLQRIAAAPAVFGYTGLILGILWDHYL